MDYKTAVALEKVILENVSYDHECEVHYVNLVNVVDFIDKNIVENESDNGK